MAQVVVQNLRNPDQIVVIVVTLLRHTIFQDGTTEPKWVLEATTREPDTEGNRIPPVRKLISSNEWLTDDVNDLVTEVCAKIGWDYIADTEPPVVSSHSPAAASEDVSVETSIVVNLEEELPSAGIDLSSIKINVKGFDLTSQATITGNHRSVQVSVTPGTKYKSAV